MAVPQKNVTIRNHVRRIRSISHSRPTACGIGRAYCGTVITVPYRSDRLENQNLDSFVCGHRCRLYFLQPSPAAAGAGPVRQNHLQGRGDLNRGPADRPGIHRGRQKHRHRQGRKDRRHLGRLPGSLLHEAWLLRPRHGHRVPAQPAGHRISRRTGRGCRCRIIICFFIKRVLTNSAYSDIMHPVPKRIWTISSAG